MTVLCVVAIAAACLSYIAVLTWMLCDARDEIRRLNAQRDKLLERLHPAAAGVLVPIEAQEPRGYGTDEDEYDAWERRERQAGRNPEETYHEYSA